MIKHNKRCQHCKADDIPLTKNSERKNVDGSITYSYLCRPCNASRAREYRKTAKGKMSYFKIQNRQIEKFREKVMARSKLSHAIKSGIVKKGSECRACGESEKRLDGHHDDYSKPLVVEWYCRPCHLAIHK